MYGTLEWADIRRRHVTEKDGLEWTAGPARPLERRRSRMAKKEWIDLRVETARVRVAGKARWWIQGWAKKIAKNQKRLGRAYPQNMHNVHPLSNLLISYKGVERDGS